MRNPVLILATALAGGALALGLWSWQQWAQTTASLNQQNTDTATVLPAPRPLPDIALIDQSATKRPMSSFKDGWSLWFFGFTHCPDICPNTLGLLAAMKKSLSEQGEPLGLNLVFVSVDPVRDTPDKLKTYVEYFDHDMIGLTGNKESIDALTNALYMPYVLREPDENGHYNVEHSGALVLVGPDAAAHAYFTPPHSISDLIKDLKMLISRES